MARQRGKQPSQRQLRVGEVVRHALARELERGTLRDPDLRNVSITVSRVDMGADLRSATAFITPLGGAEIEPVVAALNRAAPYLRKRLTRQVHLKFIPRLKFHADTTFEYAARINTLLLEPAVSRDLDAMGDIQEAKLISGEDDGASSIGAYR